MATSPKLDRETTSGSPAAATPPLRMTAEEYLAFERANEQKHEFDAGRLVAMSGATRSHNLIRLNLGGPIRAQLRDRPCEVYPSDMRVEIEGGYYYPDLTIACDPEFRDGVFDTLVNPLVVVEIISPSTEARDRGRKFGLYRKIPSLQQYVLVNQDRPSIEVYTRQGAGWLMSEVAGLDGVLRLDAAGVVVPLAEVYAKVSFPPDESPPDSTSTTAPGEAAGASGSH